MGKLKRKNSKKKKKLLMNQKLCVWKHLNHILQYNMVLKLLKKMMWKCRKKQKSRVGELNPFQHLILWKALKISKTRIYLSDTKIQKMTKSAENVGMFKESVNKGTWQD